MAFNPSEEQRHNFHSFIEELTELSKKHKIAIQSIGGVNIYSPDEDLSDIVYSEDPTSGDLLFDLVKS